MRRNEMASSKSLASAGSIVNVVTSRKSRRPSISFFVGALIFEASFSASAGKSSGKSYSASIDCISTLLSPGFPSRFTTRPTGLFIWSGQSVISTTAFSPSSAPFRSLRGMKMSTTILRLSQTRKANFSIFCMRPTKRVLALCSISTTCPSGLCILRCGNISTFTVSPCSAWRV